jgi:ubiquitin carboxyl-terminal hydrolase 36/42
MEVPKAVALVAALAFVALGALATRWLQRMEARNEEVRRLALLAAAEEETIEKEQAYHYGQYGGFVRASDLPSLWTAQEVAPAAPLWTGQAQEVAPAAPLWTGQAQEVAPAPKEVEAEAAAVAASTPAEKRVCAMCSKPTTLRCKRCKSVKYWSVSSRPALVSSSSFFFHGIFVSSLIRMLLHCATGA